LANDVGAEIKAPTADDSESEEEVITMESINAGPAPTVTMEEESEEEEIITMEASNPDQV
jgi:hypothetical protein